MCFFFFLRGGSPDFCSGMCCAEAIAQMSCKGFIQLTLFLPSLCFVGSRIWRVFIAYLSYHGFAEDKRVTKDISPFC